MSDKGRSQNSEDDDAGGERRGEFYPRRTRRSAKRACEEKRRQRWSVGRDGHSTRCSNDSTTTGSADGARATGSKLAVSKTVATGVAVRTRTWLIRGTSTTATTTSYGRWALPGKVRHGQIRRVARATIAGRNSKAYGKGGNGCARRNRGRTTATRRVDDGETDGRRGHLNDGARRRERG